MSAKELFRQKHQARLDELKTKIEHWRTEAKGATIAVRPELDERIAELDAMILEISDKLKVLSRSETAWHNLSSGVESSWSMLEKLTKDTAHRFKI
jgi:hypothetical protein